jgi:hypothetical protein
MLRIAAGVAVGLVAWFMALIGGEVILSALLPEAFGARQRAFQEVLDKGGAFTANSGHLLMHVGLGAFASVLSGLLAALIAGEKKRATLILGLLLLAIGLLKAAMSWAYVPLWYHIVFTGMLVPLVLLGGKLKQNARCEIETPTAS